VKLFLCIKKKITIQGSQEILLTFPPCLIFIFIWIAIKYREQEAYIDCSASSFKLLREENNFLLHKSNLDSMNKNDILSSSCSQQPSLLAVL